MDIELIFSIIITIIYILFITFPIKINKNLKNFIENIKTIPGINLIVNGIIKVLNGCKYLYVSVLEVIGFKSALLTLIITSLLIFTFSYIVLKNIHYFLILLIIFLIISIIITILHLIF